MVTVELVDTGLVLETLDEKITYVKQVAEIGDVTKLNASYSWTIRFPKTPLNTKAFENLGVVGSDSDTPYVRNHVNVYDNGIIIVRMGLLSISETSEDYKGYVQEGIVDFMRDIGNDEIGKVIDLSELDHRNDVNVIINSFERNDYRYIIADYNGAPLPNMDYLGRSITNLSPTSLIPSINAKYLFDKIIKHYGWTYSGDMDVSNLWMTYPKAASYEEDSGEPMGLSSFNVRAEKVPNQNKDKIRGIPYEIKDVEESFEYVLGSNDVQYRCLNTGNYKIVWNAKGNLKVVTVPGISEVPIRSMLYVNNAFVKEGGSGRTLDETEHIMTLSRGDIISILVKSGDPNRQLIVGSANIVESNLSIFQLGVQDIDFTTALIKYKVKDFFKELMIRGALVSFTDVDAKNIDFKNLDSRLSADVIDYTEKFIKRTSEKYLYNDYAQNNYFKHRYDEDGEDYYDGNLKVDNQNLEIEKELYQSKSFAPSDKVTLYNGNYPTYAVNRFKMFDVEVQEDKENGDLIATYKPLENRFYFMKSEYVYDLIYILGVLVAKFPRGLINGATFKDIVSQKYAKIGQLIRRTKIHEIDLALNAYDVSTLELDKVYYFRDEQAYYLINKIKYVSEEISKGEFIKIEKQ